MIFFVVVDYDWKVQPNFFFVLALHPEERRTRTCGNEQVCLECRHGRAHQISAKSIFFNLRRIRVADSDSCTSTLFFSSSGGWVKLLLVVHCIHHLLLEETPGRARLLFWRLRTRLRTLAFFTLAHACAVHHHHLWSFAVMHTIIIIRCFRLLCVVFAKKKRLL